MDLLDLLSMGTSEACVSQAGIRVQQHKEDPEAGTYHVDVEKETPVLDNRVDDEKETPILSAVTPPCELASDFPLLDLGESSGISAPAAPVEPAPPLVADPFSDLIKDDWSPSSAIADFLDVNPSSIHRNASAPTFQSNSAILDPFAEFLSQSASNPASTEASAANSVSTTPKPSRPNYSRTAFENPPSSTASRPKKAADIFEDLLSNQGFTATSKNVNRTLGDLKKAEEVKHMDPVAEKIYNWTGGKERNIRALLSSLNDVLWEGAENWQQPRMGDLLSASQVKRSYYKACLVVHPDKQVGEPHEMLARAIFTELNDAWNAFEQEGSKSL